MPINFHAQASHTGDAISDKNYYFDAEGNVTEDEAKGVRWLAREGANVLPEFRDALKAFQEVAQPEEADEKAATPKANKSRTPASNKGVKE